jgi:hypothetical protein
MSWAAVNTKALTTPALRQLPSAAHKLLWLAGRLHCAEFLTNGLIETAALPLLAFEAGVDVDQARQFVRALLEVGLWTSDPRGWIDTTFLDDNSSREVRERALERDRDKKRKKRGSGVSPGDSTGGQHRGTAPGDSPSDVPQGVPKAQVERERQYTETETERTPPKGTHLSDTAGEVAQRVQNGRIHVDGDRRERIKELLINAIQEHGSRTEKADQRWLAYVDQLSVELARANVTERELKGRARTWFDESVWSNLGDLQQKAKMRIYMHCGSSPTRAQLAALETTR